MPARKLDNMPSREQALAEAPNHQSLSSLARHFGVEPSSFWRCADKGGWKPDVEALLAKAPSAQAAFDPEEAPSENEVLRQRMGELERAVRAHRTVDVFEERALSGLKDAIEARKPTYSPRVIPKSQRSSSQHEFVLLWSDTHAGEVVSEVETSGLNAYDWRIMLKRHDRIRESVFSYQDNRPYPVSKLHVLALGDMLSGDIHDELVSTNEIPLAEATIQFAEDGATWLESFLERFSRVDVAGVVGNHPRSTRKPAAKQSFNNADWLAYQAMSRFLSKQKAIGWDIPKASAHPVQVCGRRILMWHGDGIRSTMPGVPWGGVMRRAAALSAQYGAKGLPLDHFAVGHFHQSNAVQGGRILMNGSVKGVDEYVLKAFGGGEEPKQLLLTFHPKRGLTDVSLIDCA
jgi:hypothetical protein